MQEIEIRIDDLTDGSVVGLLKEHHEEMYLYSPPESIHAVDTVGMNDPGLTFWSAWFGGRLAGCGALKELSREHGEIKSMRTSKEFLRKGVGSKILSRILDEAQRRFYKRISLETGTHEAFAPAIRLYQRFGFTECEPFGNYVVDPYSVFFTRYMAAEPEGGLAGTV